MAKRKAIKKKPRKAPTKVNVKKEFPFTKYIPYFGLAIILILVAIIKANFLSIPFERDEGTYCYLGQLILDGKVPFRDFFEMKFPGLFYAYAAILWIFGSSLEQIQTGFIFVNLITIVLLFLIGRKLFSDGIALIITASFALIAMSPHTSGFTVQAEHLMMMFVCGGLLLLIYAINSNSIISFFVAGILICFSFLIKQSGIFFIFYGGLVLLVYYWIKKDQSLMRGIKNSLVYAAGVFILFIAFLIIMLSYGVFDEMKYWIFERAGSYVSKHSVKEGFEFLKLNFSKNATHYELFWISGLLGIVLIFFTRLSSYKKFILLAFAVLSFLTIVPGFRFLGHYWIQTLPAVSIFIGITVMFLIELLSKVIKQSTAQILVFSVFTILLIIHLNNNKKYYFNPNNTEVLREVYQMNPFPEAKVLGDFIKENTNEEDKIALIGSEPQVHIYSGRRCVSKFKYYFSVLMSDTTTYPESKDRQMEFIEDIIREKPKYMIVFRHRNSIWASPNGSYMIFNRFDEITNKDYNLICFVDMISDFNTQYIWYDKLNQYEPTGLFSILLFERKSEEESKPSA